MKEFDDTYMAHAGALAALIKRVGNVRDFMAILETAMGSVVDPTLFEDDGKIDVLSEDAYNASSLLSELNVTLAKEGFEHSPGFMEKK